MRHRKTREDKIEESFIQEVETILEKTYSSNYYMMEYLAHEAISELKKEQNTKKCIKMLEEKKKRLFTKEKKKRLFIKERKTSAKISTKSIKIKSFERLLSTTILAAASITSGYTGIILTASIITQIHLVGIISILTSCIFSFGTLHNFTVYKKGKVITLKSNTSNLLHCKPGRTCDQRRARYQITG